MGKGGGPKTLNRKGGGAPVLSVSHLGPGPRPRSDDVCHEIVNYHVTNFTDEESWCQSKRLLIIETKIPEKRFKNSSLEC